MTIPRLAEADGVIAAYMFTNESTTDYLLAEMAGGDLARTWLPIVANAMDITSKSIADDVSVQIADAQRIVVRVDGNEAIAVVILSNHPRGKSINRSMRKVLNNYKTARSAEAVAS